MEGYPAGKGTYPIAEMSKKYWNNNIKNMMPYVPGFQPELKDNLIKLNTNENPYPPSPKVIEAIKVLTGDLLRFYPKSDWEDLRKAISEVYSCNLKQVFCGNGSDEVLSLIFRCFTNSGDSVLFTYPTYSLYATLAEISGIDYSYVETKDDFSIDFDVIKNMDYKLAFIANPNAPTGRIEPLSFIKDFAASFKGLVIIDEAYIDFSDSPDGFTSLNLINDYSNIIVLRTFSKSYSLCGIRAGYAFANEDLISAMMIAKDSYNLDLLAQAGAKAAVLDQAWMKNNAQKIINTRKETQQKLISMGFEVIPSQANFLFATHPDLDTLSVYNELIKNNIYVRYFNKPRIANYLRISIGTDNQMGILLGKLKYICDSIVR